MNILMHKHTLSHPPSTVGPMISMAVAALSTSVAFLASRQVRSLQSSVANTGVFVCVCVCVCLRLRTCADVWLDDSTSSPGGTRYTHTRARAHTHTQISIYKCTCTVAGLRSVHILRSIIVRTLGDEGQGQGQAGSESESGPGPGLC